MFCKQLFISEAQRIDVKLEGDRKKFFGVAKKSVDGDIYGHPSLELVCDVSHEIESTLQDELRRELVDDFGASLPCDVLRNQVAFYRLCREAFVPKRNGQIGLFRQIGCELPDRLAARALSAVHINR